MISPATRHARLVSSAMSIIHRYASLCEVGWEEGEARTEVARNCSKLLDPIDSDGGRITWVFLR